MRKWITFQDGNLHFGNRLFAIFLTLGFIAIGVWGFAARSPSPETRFEAHEFAVFRSEYGSLRAQSPQKRAERFRELLEVTENAKLTPAMSETLAAFVHSVLASEEEAGEVKAEAKRVLRTLENHPSNRAPASVENPQ